MRKIYFVVIFALLFRTNTSFGWGGTGHKIVAEIAKAYLEPGVEDSVIKYFGTMSFESAATWMDAVRSDKTYDYLKPWHYVNIDKGQNYIEVGDPNVINELAAVVKKLVDKETLANDALFFDLKVLFHLVGDIHQPLHVGYGVDYGGNSINVSFLSTTTNLHHVWDSDIITDADLTYLKCLAMASGLSAAQLKQIMKIDVMEWMLESRSLLDSVYDYSQGTIAQNYIDKNAPLIERQLVNAGLRLASALNARFRSANTPVSNILVAPITHITIYPNPFTSYAQFNIINCPPSAQLNIVNIFGEHVRTIAHPAISFELQRNELCEGIYLYYLYDKGTIVDKGKFIIKN